MTASEPNGRPIGEVSSATLDRASVAPACFAALAESGVLFLPLQEVVRELTFARGGPLVRWPVFVLAFVGGVGLATAFRRSRRSTAAAIGAAVAIGVVQTVWWGRGGPFAGAGVVILSLAVTLRVVTLAARDWREPIGTSVLIGAVALLIEVAIAGGATEPWPTLMGPVVAVFFVASLASRAASVRIDEVGVPRQRLGPEMGERGTAVRMAAPALATVAGVLVLVAASGGRGGALHWLGFGIATGLGWIVLAGIWIMSPLVVPLAWLANLINIDLFAALRRVAEHLSVPQAAARHAGHDPFFERAVSAAILAAVIALLVWMIRRRRRLRPGPIARRPAPTQETPVSISVSPGERLRHVFRPRRELPEVTVRRWYAEALLALERRGLSRPDHRTPAEFVPAVGRAFPAVRSSFEDLTHAYEDVRYGDREVTSVRLAHLGARRAALLDTIRSAARADEADVSDHADDGEPAGA